MNFLSSEQERSPPKARNERSPVKVLKDVTNVSDKIVKNDHHTLPSLHRRFYHSFTNKGPFGATFHGLQTNISRILRVYFISVNLSQGKISSW